MYLHRADVAAFPAHCISGSDAAQYLESTFSTQNLLVPVFRLPVLCCSHFEQSLSSIHNDKLPAVELVTWARSIRCCYTRISTGLPVPSSPLGEEECCRCIPLPGCIRYRCLASPADSPLRSSSDRRSGVHLYFIPVQQINSLSASRNILSLLFKNALLFEGAQLYN